MSGPSSAFAYFGGDWRCTTDPLLFVAGCPACRAPRPALWVYEGPPLRVTCANGCTLDAITHAAARDLAGVWLDRNYDRDLRATMDPSDDLYDISAWVYFPAITGREPDAKGWVQCPFHAGGEERTPSLQLHDAPLPPWWKCHACGAGGTVYDLAALTWGIEPRRDGFHAIRERVAVALLGVMP